MVPPCFGSLLNGGSALTIHGVLVLLRRLRRRPSLAASAACGGRVAAPVARGAVVVVVGAPVLAAVVVVLVVVAAIVDDASVVWAAVDKMVDAAVDVGTVLRPVIVVPAVWPTTLAVMETI